MSGRIKAWLSWRAENYLFRKAVRDLSQGVATLHRMAITDDEHAIEFIIEARKLGMGLSYQQETITELARVLREANVRGDYEHFAGQLVESGRIIVAKTYEQAMDELRASGE